jgi:putative transposase
VKYAFVRAHGKQFSIKRMCQVLEVSRGGYYDWHGRKECERSRHDRLLLDAIRKIHQDTREAYGAVKTWRALKEAGIACGNIAWHVLDV